MGDEVRAALAAIARRWVEEGWRHDDALPDGHIVDDLHAPCFIDHDSGDRAADNAGFREGIARLLAAFPGLRAEARDFVVETSCAGASGGLSGSVAVRWTAVGTQTGAYLGAAPVNRPVHFKGIEIIRVDDGRITERWGEWDGLELLAQLNRGTP
jgi:predicted ester cyclase